MLDRRMGRVGVPAESWTRRAGPGPELGQVLLAAALLVALAL